jgi:cytochrome c peroxidase
MTSKKVLTYMVIGAAVLLLAVSVGTVAAKGPTLTPQEELGKALFFDKSLSEPRGQACAACHAPNVGYTGPDAKINAQGAVYEGAVKGVFGNRKPPTAAYAGDSPILGYDGTTWVGGMFWDGRATGLTLGDPLAEQAQGPFLNPREQNNPDAQAVVDKALKSSYRHLFLQVCGSGKTVDEYYECIGRSIAAYERSKEVSPFTSKFDYWLKGQAKLTSQEGQGLDLFRGKAKCDGCHVSTGPQPLFTDFTYDNLGVPKNPKNPFYTEPSGDPNFVDTGLGDTLMKAGYPAAVYEPELGKMKVPTLRNVDKRPNDHFVKAYSHNGYFKSLEEIVHFYNTRDVPGAGWPAPEVAANVNTSELGNLGLTRGEEKALVAFLKTLSDGYKP